MKADQIVDVTVNYCGKDKPAKVGYYIRYRPILENGKWVNSDEEETIFGYCGDSGYLTHMCYGSSYVDWDEFAVTDNHALKFDKMYFDAGSNKRPLYIEYNELQRAMAELGLVDKELIAPCRNCLHPRGQHTTMGDCNKILEENERIEVNCSCAAFIEVGDD